MRGEISDGIGLDHVTGNLVQIGASAERASKRVKDLDLRLEAEAASDRRRSVVQTLTGTVVGLIGGFWAGWVNEGGAFFAEGQLGRAALVAAACIAVVLAMPPVAYRVLDRILRRL